MITESDTAVVLQYILGSFDTSLLWLDMLEIWMKAVGRKEIKHYLYYS